MFVFQIQAEDTVLIISFFAISQTFVTILSFVVLSVAVRLVRLISYLAFPVLSIVLANSKAVATLVTTHTFNIALAPVSYTHLTLPTICSV